MISITSLLLVEREAVEEEEAAADDDDAEAEVDKLAWLLAEGIVAAVIGQAGSMRLTRTSRS